jgi:hypothetical protein
MELFAELDPASEAAIARLANPALLDPALVNMLQQTIEDMQQAATDYMYATFLDPQGGVENSWEPVVQSTTLATLTNTAPYARRLNFGFSQRFDSLNRYFEAWPLAYPDGYHWAEYALEKVTPDVEKYFQTGFESAVGGG